VSEPLATGRNRCQRVACPQTPAHACHPVAVGQHRWGAVGCLMGARGHAWNPGAGGSTRSWAGAAPPTHWRMWAGPACPSPPKSMPWPSAARCAPGVGCHTAACQQPARCHAPRSRADVGALPPCAAAEWLGVRSGGAQPAPDLPSPAIQCVRCVGVVAPTAPQRGFNVLRMQHGSRHDRGSQQDASGSGRQGALWMGWLTPAACAACLQVTTSAPGGGACPISALSPATGALAHPAPAAAQPSPRQRPSEADPVGDPTRPTPRPAQGPQLASALSCSVLQPMDPLD
jgi:hypothetical protein